jgi:hypothetical protein
MLNFNPVGFKNSITRQTSPVKKRGCALATKTPAKPTITPPVKFGDNSRGLLIQHGLNNLKQGWPYLLAFVAFSSGIAIMNPLLWPLVLACMPAALAIQFIAGMIKKTPG